MNYRDRQAKNKIESEKVYYSTPKTDNKAIQIGAKQGETGRFSVIHNDGGVTSNGDKAFNASAPQDGFVRGNASGNAISLDHRNVRRDARLQPEEDEATGDVVILFQKDNKLYVGGDRVPEQIYELNVGATFLGNPKINKTSDGYIVTFVVAEESTQLLCAIVDGGLITSELSSAYPYKEIDGVSDSYSDGINCTLLNAQFNVFGYRLFDVPTSGGSYSVLLGQSDCIGGIIQEPTVIGTTGTGGSYGVQGNSLSITAPFVSGLPSYYHNFLDQSRVSAIFAFNGDYGDTVVNVGEIINYEFIVGDKSYFGQASTQLLDGSVKLVVTWNPTPNNLPPPFFWDFFPLQTQTRNFAIRLRKQHPNLLNQNGFISGATIRELATPNDGNVFSQDNSPRFEAYSFAADTLNNVEAIITEGSAILNQLVTVILSATPYTAYSYFIFTSLLKLYFNTEEFLELKAWTNYNTLASFIFGGVDLRDQCQKGFRSYLIAISLDRTSSMYATYNPETTDDDIHLTFNNSVIGFKDLYLNDVFDNEDPKNGVHLFNFYSPNLVQNKIYTVTDFPVDEESGEVDIAIAEIQDNAVSFSTQKASYIGITDEFKDYIIDASFLG
jgi:hypothetical protein